MTRHSFAELLARGDAIRIKEQQLYRKARQIIADPTHPQHRLLVDLVETALVLDPPDDTDWCPPSGIARPWLP